MMLRPWNIEALAMATTTRFEEIHAWQTARALTRRIYEISSGDAFAGDPGLRDEMRRAAVSIMSNIAGGFESDTEAQFISFLGRARASAGEIRAQLRVALDVGYVTEDEFEALLVLTETCSRQLSALVVHLRRHLDRRQSSDATEGDEIEIEDRSDVQMSRHSNGT